MGGDSGGNDCVHVTDVRVEVAHTALERHYAHGLLRRDTDVLVSDEHGGHAQFTYQEFRDHVAAVKAGKYDHIGRDTTIPERVCPSDEEHPPHDWVWGNDEGIPKTDYWCKGWKR